MADKRCDRGHYYDSSKHAYCPYCGIPGIEFGATVLQGAGAPNQLRAVGARQQSKTQPERVPKQAAEDRKHGKTIAVFQEDAAMHGFDPVVGWLVCIKGPERGRDYRIRAQKNSIGRAENMDIRLAADPAVSREAHAFVVYDPRSNTFSVRAGESRGLVYLNGEEVMACSVLKAYDILELGQTKLLFIPCCSEKFQWTGNE